MAETAENPNSQEQSLTADQQAIKEQFDFHSAMAFGEKPLTATATNQSPETVVTTTQENTPQVTPESDTEEFDEPVYLKNTFGWETKEQALADLEELKQLRGKPQTQAEIAFANEESKKIHQLLKEGKTKEVRTYLEAQELLANVETMDTDKQLKLYIKMQNPLFDQELIDYQFDKDYKFDDSKFKDEDGIVTDPMGLRFAKVAAQQKIQNDLSKATDFFTTYKTKIELPDISTPVQNVDKDYEEWQASNAKSSQDYNNVIVPAVNALKESDLQLSVKVDDPKNQMQFEVSIAPDANDLTAVKQDSLDVFGYLAKTVYDEKGNFNAARLNRIIMLDKNFDKYAQSIARQAVNAERARVVNKESGGKIIERNFNVNPQQLTELQKEAERAFAV